MRDDEDVILLEVRSLGDDGGQIVARADLGQAFDWDDPQLAQGRPVTRRPVCVL